MKYRIIMSAVLVAALAAAAFLVHSGDAAVTTPAPSADDAAFKSLNIN